MEMAIATIARLVNSLRGLKRALENDETWGIAMVRSRILWYLRATIEGCERAGQFAKTSRVARICLGYPDFSMARHRAACNVFRIQGAVIDRKSTRLNSSHV